MTHEHPPAASGGGATDPVCGMAVAPGRARGGSAEHAGATYWFCGPSCRAKFVADPGRYLSPASPPPPDPRTYTRPMHPEVRQAGPGACPACGMALEPILPLPGADGESETELADMTRRFWVSLALSAPLLALAMGEMVVSIPVPPWGQLLLAAPVVLWGGAPFFVRGWQGLITGRLNMFTLIALGVAAAFGYSVFALLLPGALPETLRRGGAPPVYFEAAAVITTLVLLGQVLELRARRATSAAIR